MVLARLELRGVRSGLTMVRDRPRAIIDTVSYGQLNFRIFTGVVLRQNDRARCLDIKFTLHSGRVYT